MSEKNGTEPCGWLNAQTLKPRAGELVIRNGHPTDEAGA